MAIGVRFGHRNDSSRALAGAPAANKRSAVKGCYSWVTPNPIADFGYERLNVWRCERGNAHLSHVHTPQRRIRSWYRPGAGVDSEYSSVRNGASEGYFWRNRGVPIAHIERANYVMSLGVL